MSQALIHCWCYAGGHTKVYNPRSWMYAYGKAYKPRSWMSNPEVEPVTLPKHTLPKLDLCLFATKHVILELNVWTRQRIQFPCWKRCHAICSIIVWSSASHIVSTSTIQSIAAHTTMAFRTASCSTPNGSFFQIFKKGWHTNLLNNEQVLSTAEIHRCYITQWCRSWIDDISFFPGLFFAVPDCSNHILW